MLLKHFEGTATTQIDAEPQAVFAALTDIARLPEWNDRIAAVVQPPGGSLAPGSVWKVQMHVPPAKWVSVATVRTYDPVTLRFAHRSQTDDGNPSYADWTWKVTPAGDGAQLSVTWDINPRTFWRQLLFAKLRRRQLADEVPTSLAAIAARSRQLSLS